VTVAALITGALLLTSMMMLMMRMRLARELAKVKK
jgi:hypothetical protein